MGVNPTQNTTWKRSKPCTKRPDLCEYQCNGALSAAKQYKCAPIKIAQAVVEKLNAEDYSLVEAVMPGFINLKLSDHFLQAYLEKMRTTEDFGIAKEGAGKTIVVDYGGPNVAKPLHIGHLRSAIIGESLKRLYKFFGYNTIGDIHLGDWGLQMGHTSTGQTHATDGKGMGLEVDRFSPAAVKKLFDSCSARSS